MKLSTENIIKIIPLEEAFKDELLKQLPSLTPDQRYNMADIIWGAYYTYLDILVERNVELALERAKEGKETLDKSLYKRIYDETEKELQTTGAQVVSEKDLETARAAMEKIVKEMKASKMPIKSD